MSTLTFAVLLLCMGSVLIAIPCVLDFPVFRQTDVITKQSQNVSGISVMPSFSYAYHQDVRSSRERDVGTKVTVGNMVHPACTTGSASECEAYHEDTVSARGHIEGFSRPVDMHPDFAIACTDYNGNALQKYATQAQYAIVDTRKNADLVALQEKYAAECICSFHITAPKHTYRLMACIPPSEDDTDLQILARFGSCNDTGSASYRPFNVIDSVAVGGSGSGSESGVYVEPTMPLGQICHDGRRVQHLQETTRVLPLTIDEVNSAMVSNAETTLLGRALHFSQNHNMAKELEVLIQSTLANGAVESTSACMDTATSTFAETSMATAYERDNRRSNNASAIFGNLDLFGRPCSFNGTCDGTTPPFWGIDLRSYRTLAAETCTAYTCKTAQDLRYATIVLAFVVPMVACVLALSPPSIQSNPMEGKFLKAIGIVAALAAMSLSLPIALHPYLRSACVVDTPSAFMLTDVDVTIDSETEVLTTAGGVMLLLGFGCYSVGMIFLILANGSQKNSKNADDPTDDGFNFLGN